MLPAHKKNHETIELDLPMRTTEMPQPKQPVFSPRPNQQSPLFWKIVLYTIPCLIPVLMAGVYYRSAQTAGIAAGFPLDDSWIHANYTRSLIEGRPFEYNPGQLSMGTTAVLFNGVWAAATAITGEYVYTIYTVNTLLTMATALLLVRILFHYGVSSPVACIGAALIVASPPFGWSNLSGMETALAAFLTVAAVLAHLTWGEGKTLRPLAAPVLMALAAMSRPENLILYPLSEADRLWMRWRASTADHRPKAFRRFGIRLSVFLLTLLPYIGLNYSIHGAPLPNTYKAKLGRMQLNDAIETNGLEAVANRLGKACEVPADAMIFVATRDNMILVLLAGAGVLVCFVPRWRQTGQTDSILPLLVFLGGTSGVGMVTMGALFPGEAQRYLAQWIPMLLLLGVVGMNVLVTLARKLPWTAIRWPGALTLAVITLADVVLLVCLHRDHIEYYVNSVNNINEMQVSLGRWVNNHTPADAMIATNDIGAIAFFGHRTVVDTVGLIDPETIRRKQRSDPTEALIGYLQERGVTHALLFPSWHPDLVLDPRFQPIKRVVLEHNVVCGEDRMLVMQLNWTGEKTYEPPEWLEAEQENCRLWKGVFGF